MGGFLAFCYNQLTFTPKPLPHDIDLRGRTALITGANSGLGFETAREFLSHGLSRLIIGARDVAKGEEAKKSLADVHSDCNIQVWYVDYEHHDSIIAFAKRAASLDGNIDYVLLNAGLKKMEYTASHTGHELNVQTNHLGTSLLSLLLISTLRKTVKTTGTPVRMTIVSSEGHFWIPFHEKTASNILARMDEPESFGTKMQRYYTTKLLNVLWMRELANRINTDEIIINTVNPGFCYSGLHRYETTGIINIFLWLLGWTSEQGGHCLADALVVHDDSHGKYLSEQRVTEY
jgi:retinol dehydrogenase-12